MKQKVFSVTTHNDCFFFHPRDYRRGKNSPFLIRRMKLDPFCFSDAAHEPFFLLVWIQRLVVDVADFIWVLSCLHPTLPTFHLSVPFYHFPLKTWTCCGHTFLRPEVYLSLTLFTPLFLFFLSSCLKPTLPRLDHFLLTLFNEREPPGVIDDCYDFLVFYWLVLCVSVTFDLNELKKKTELI